MSEHLTVSEGGGRGAPGRHTTGNALATRLEMLLRADAALLERELTTGNARWLGMDLLVIALGAGAFGAAMGSWRAPEQALWAALKLRLVLIATAAGNAAINGMLASLLGVDLQPRESLAAVLASFALAAVILGAFSPVMAFVVWNLPPPRAGVPLSIAARSAMLLALVGLIACAGVTANLRLWEILRVRSRDGRAASRLVSAWLAINLLLGSQVSWIARPFIGKAHVPVVFLEAHAWRGSFFEELGRMTSEFFQNLSAP